jgi:hypothetical protein
MLEARRESTGKLHQDHLSAFLLEHASSMEYRRSPFTSAVSYLVWQSSTGSGGSDPLNELPADLCGHVRREACVLDVGVEPTPASSSR